MDDAQQTEGEKGTNQVQSPTQVTSCSQHVNRVFVEFYCESSPGDGRRE